VLAQLPILQVILPMLAAPLCLLLGQGVLVWVFACIVSALTFSISVVLLCMVMQGGPISYELGGWQAPWGIEYYIDALSAFILVLVSGMGSIVLLASRTSLHKELDAATHTGFYIAFLLCMAGLLGIVATGDAFNLFVFLEISALSSYTLIALGRDRRALWAAYQYLLMGSIGATFILIGIGLLYMMTGTLNMADLAQRLPAVADSQTAFTAYAFLMVGVCLKLALFPLHLWLPNAYAYAPSMVTVFLAATATKVAIYILLRFNFSVFGEAFMHNEYRGSLPSLALMLGLLGIFAASTMAIYQNDLKRIFAYSSVAQIGYMILGFGIGGVAGVTATVLHVFNHALMKGALFMALSGVVYRLGSANIDVIDGLGRRMPYTMAAIVIGGLSLIGVPLTVGFVSKWYLVLAALERGWWPLAWLVLLGSLLAVIYIWRIVERAYFRAPASGAEEVQEAPLSILLPTWLLVLANVYFGIDTRFPVALSEISAQSLFGVGR
jgi:multicomponent Na+:H+ antiporter subunit D